VIERTTKSTHLLVKDQQSGQIEEVHYSQLKPLDASNKPDARSRPIDSLSEEELAEAKRRLEIIRPVLNLREGVSDAVKKQAKANNLGSATLYRWIKAYKDRGLLSDLAPRRKRRRMPKRLDPKVEAIIWNVIEEHYLTSQKPSTEDTIKEINDRCKAARLKPPHPNTIRARIKAIDKKKAMERREGRKAAHDKYGDAAGHFPGADYPLAVVQIDHTKVDIELVDDEHRMPIGRPWLTLAIDVYSRMVTGLHLSLDPPSAFSVGLCVGNSILQKHMLLERLNVQGEWPVWGIMDALHADNGKDFRSNTLKNACDEHGINLVWRPVGKPHWGGHIERLMGTVAKKIHALSGTTFANTRQKGSYKPEKHATMTLAELERFLVTWVVGVYHQREHKGIQMSPLAKWELGINGNGRIKGRGLPSPVADEERLRIDFLPYVERTVQRDGIEWDKIQYFGKALSSWIEAKKDGRMQKFIVRRDPRDISHVWFLDPDLNQYLPIPCAAERPSISLWEFRAIRDQLKQEGIKDPTEEEIFARRQMSEIKEESKKATRKTRRLEQRKKHWREAGCPPPEAGGSAPNLTLVVDNDSDEFDIPDEDLAQEFEEWI
jgi:putative transposase